MPKFIKTELKSDSNSDSESDLEKMEAKLITNWNLVLIMILYMISFTDFFICMDDYK